MRHNGFFKGELFNVYAVVFAAVQHIKLEVEGFSARHGVFGGYKQCAAAVVASSLSILVDMALNDLSPMVTVAFLPSFMKRE